METAKLQKELESLLGDRFSTSNSKISNYARGEDIFDPVLPQAVAFPNTNEEISSIVKLCNKNLIPIVPFGAGTSLEGHTDIGIGTIVGSNIYNILMIMGVASVITGIAVVPGIFTDYLVMIGFAVVLVAFLRSGIIPRPAGIGLAIAYAVYLGYTLLY